MAQESENRSELERQLTEKRESIDRRIDVLEDEIVSTPAAIRSSLAKHPVVGVAGAVAAGLAVGLLFGVRKKRSSRVAPLHQRLVEQYIDAVGDEVRRKTRRGKNMAEAVRESLRDRTPLIVYAPRLADGAQESRGFISQLGDIALKTALGFTIKTAIDFITASLNVKELQQMLALEEEEERRAGAAADRGTSGNGAAESFEERSGLEPSPPET